MSSVIVWDIETVPDLKGFAAANGHDGKNDEEIRAAMGDKFPKHIYQSIICIGALVAHREESRWAVDALGAPHIGERSEKSLISSFADSLVQQRSCLKPWSAPRHVWWHSVVFRSIRSRQKCRGSGASQ